MSATDTYTDPEQSSPHTHTHTHTHTGHFLNINLSIAFFYAKVSEVVCSLHIFQLKLCAHFLLFSRIMSRPLFFYHPNSIRWQDVNNKSGHHPQSRALLYVTAADIPVKRTKGNSALTTQFSKSSYQFHYISRCLVCARAFVLQFNSISFPNNLLTTETNVGIKFLTLQK